MKTSTTNLFIISAILVFSSCSRHWVDVELDKFDSKNFASQLSKNVNSIAYSEDYHVYKESTEGSLKSSHYFTLIKKVDQLVNGKMKKIWKTPKSPELEILEEVEAADEVEEMNGDKSKTSNTLTLQVILDQSKKTIKMYSSQTQIDNAKPIYYGKYLFLDATSNLVENGLLLASIAKKNEHPKGNDDLEKLEKLNDLDVFVFHITSKLINGDQLEVLELKHYGEFSKERFTSFKNIADAFGRNLFFREIPEE